MKHSLAVATLGVAVLGMAMLGMACTPQPGPDTAPASLGAASPVEQDGVIYTPMSIGPESCVLYNIRIPGGDAPAAMVYQSVDGAFTYGRPDNCVKAGSAQ